MILNYYNDLVYRPSELFLNKDFGQVATVLGSLHGMRVKHLICCNKRNISLHTFAGAEVVQAKKKFGFLPRKLDFLKNLTAYWFLFRHRRTFTVLVMFPFWPPSDLLVAKLFLAFNPDAKVIIKLDANLSNLERLQASYDVSPRSHFRQHYYYRRLLEIAEIVIYETIGVGRLLTQNSFLGLNSPAKFVNIFNGISASQVRATIGSVSDLASREQIIIFSGRLSSPQKNVELIFRSDPVPKGWRIKFIGGVDEAFQEVIKKYRSSDPDFEKKYEFVGEITDKPTYLREFSSGRILLLCSAWEGFPMVFAEAHYFGLYIVTTDVSGAAEATNSGKYGKVIPLNDPVALREALHTACTDPDLVKITKNAQAYGSRYFIWEDSLRAPAISKIFATHD